MDKYSLSGMFGKMQKLVNKYSTVGNKIYLLNKYNIVNIKNMMLAE